MFASGGQLPDFSLGGVCHRQVPGRPVSAADRTAESGKCEPPAGVTGFRGFVKRRSSKGDWADSREWEEGRSVFCTYTMRADAEIADLVMPCHSLQYLVPEPGTRRQGQLIDSHPQIPLDPAQPKEKVCK